MEEAKGELPEIKSVLPAGLFRRNGFFGRHAWLIVAVIAVIGVTMLPTGVGATEIGQQVLLIVAKLFHVLVSVVGQLLLLLIGALIWIARYNGFVDSTAVASGWVIVRDIANMFFIVALLLIAFGTILGFSNYHYSSTLPRLVIMAVAVNFSRTICGLIIDFSQVVMLTFVNGFKDAAGGNFINSFGLANLLQVDPNQNPGETEDLLWGVTLSLILALILVIIASGVVVIMIAVLVVRIVYLWLLVVLSPLAFMASAAPVKKASSFYGKWWDMFNEQVAVGPLLAFFLWLALISVNDAGGQVFAGATATTDTLGGTAASSFTQHDVAGTIQKFIISIGMLLGGVSMAKSMSGTAVGYGQSVLRGAGKVAKGVTKWAGRTTYKVSGAEQAVDKSKERVYTGLGRFSPIGGAYFRSKAAEQRKTIASKNATDSENAGMMTERELEQNMKMPALTNSARSKKKAAIKEYLKRAQDPDDDISKKMNVSQFHALRKDAKRLGDATYDGSMEKDFDEFAKKNSRFIVDPNSTGEERKTQIGKFNKAWANKSASSLVEANSKEYTPQAMMRARAAALNNGYNNMSDEQAKAMLNGLGLNRDANLSDAENKRRMGLRKEFEGLDSSDPDENKRRLEIIREAQQGLRSKNFEYLSDSEKSAQIRTSPDASAIRGLGTANIGTIDAEVFKSDAQLSANVGNALTGDEIKRLPKEIGDAVRGALLSAGNNDKYLAAGGKFESVFPVDAAGNFADQSGRDSLNKWMQSGPASERIAKIPPEVLTRNGGDNDVALLAASKISSAGLQRMAEGNNHAQVAVLMAALEKISQKAVLVGPGADQNLVNAKANAERILAEVNSGGTLAASLQGMTFKNRAGASIGRGAAAVAGGYQKGKTAVARGYDRGTDALMGAVDVVVDLDKDQIRAEAEAAVDKARDVIDRTVGRRGRSIAARARAARRMLY
ncbi:MAG: hypothetical protein ABIJ46_02875 [bacterium]